MTAMRRALLVVLLGTVAVSGAARAQDDKTI